MIGRDASPPHCCTALIFHKCWKDQSRQSRSIKQRGHQIVCIIVMIETGTSPPHCDEKFCILIERDAQTPDGKFSTMFTNLDRRGHIVCIMMIGSDASPLHCDDKFYIMILHKCKKDQSRQSRSIKQRGH